MPKLYTRCDLVISYLKGSGPGGQNRNKRETGVRIEHLPTGIVAMATERRSQGQNLSKAYERLEAKLEKRFHVERPRVDTRPTKASLRRRSEAKSQRSEIKKYRRKPNVME